MNHGESHRRRPCCVRNVSAAVPPHPGPLPRKGVWPAIEPRRGGEGDNLFRTSTCQSHTHEASWNCDCASRIDVSYSERRRNLLP